MEDYRETKQYFYDVLMEKMDFSKEMADGEIQDMIDELIVSESRNKHISFSTRGRIRRELFCALRKLDVLQELIEDSGITEIMVNGTDHIFIEKGGKLQRYEHTFESTEKLNNVIQQITAGCNRVVNESVPIVDARLPNGSRVNVVLRPVALNGPILTIRRFPDEPVTMEKLLEYRSITEEAAKFLKGVTASKYNIFISGGTGSGKTTFLNALSAFIPQDERLITIEDSAELQIRNIPNLIRLETRNANAEGCTEITIRDLIKTSLRMRPDRIIVGEVRGGEAADLISAYNTGHDGSLSTGHGNSCIDMLSRLEMMVLMAVDIPIQAIKQQLASGIDIMIHLGRLRDKTRKVLEISELTGLCNGQYQLNCLFQFEEEAGSRKDCVKGKLVRKGVLENQQKLKAAGMVPSEI